MKNLLKPSFLLGYSFVLIFLVGAVIALLSGGESIKYFMADFALRESYIMIIIAFGGCLVLPIWANLDNLKSFVNIGIGLGAMIVLFLLGYILSDASLSPKFQEMGVTEGVSKSVGASLIMSYIMILGLVGLIVYGEVVKFFDR